ncbi:carbohydrate-binding family 9-like protein [candidate division KSB1 bacterium]|nr:carbohydrate-binding family 9-like protein [candidate division KSB1 bacterium]
MKNFKLSLFFVFTSSFILFNFILSCNKGGSQVNNKEIFTEPQIEFAPRNYICYQANESIKIDGKITESAWSKADWTEDFVDIEGDLKPKPKFRTRTKMLWDDEYFYFAAELEEPHVWATLMQRDTVIFYDNDFEVFIDPDGDTHQYYEFEMNAYSTEWDLFLVKPYRDGGPAINAWDIQGLKTAVFVDGTINDPGDEDKCWTLEIAMPWAVLKECAHKDTPPKQGDQWRIGFSRVQWQSEIKNSKYQKKINPKTGKSFPENNWIWSAQGLINMHYPEMWGFVQFSEKLVGHGTDEFKMKNQEFAKWALRQVYYKQQTYQMNFGKYTNCYDDLNLKDIKISGYKWPPSINITNNLFEATTVSSDGKEFWHICQDGRVWQTTKSE